MPYEPNYGCINITLDEYLKRNDISKNFLAEKANLQRTQLNTYCKNMIKRPDLDVLARICFALDCELTDIIDYRKPSKKVKENPINDASHTV